MNLSVLDQAINLEENGLFWEAGELYKRILLELNSSNTHKKEKLFCKRKIKEMNKKREKDFNTFSFEYNFTPKQQKEIRGLIEKAVNNENPFYFIGHSQSLFPKFDEVVASSKETMPFSYQYCNLSSQDKDGNLIKGGNNGELSWLKRMYGIQQEFIVQIYLKPIFCNLIDERKLTLESISSIFNQNIFSESFLKVFKVAIGRFLDGDYISALHILVPRFEKLFIDLTDLISGGGIDTLSVRNQKSDGSNIWTEEKTLSEDFLSNNSIQDLWGKDFCEQLNFVFLDSLGYKLRHKLAHGYIDLNELNFDNAVLVIYFYIVVATRLKLV